MGQIFPLRFAPMDPIAGKDRYLACYRDAWTVAHGSLAGFSERSAWIAADERLRRDPDCSLEAYLGDRFAGILALDMRRGKWTGTGWIVLCFLVGELRGMGLGRQLIDKAADCFRSAGRRRLRLTVAPKNPALGFYEHLGFRRVGTEPGAQEDLLVMERTI